MERGWILDRQSGEGKQATHLLMDGGRLCVPKEDSGTFLQHMASLLAGGHIPSVVELKTSVFRMMMDLDIEHMNPDISVHDFSNMLALIREAAFHFWHTMDENKEHVLPRMIACSAPLKKTSDGNVKLGIHLIFPDIYTTCQMANAFRMILLPVLEDRCVVEQGLINSFEKIIDNTVFQANGLRMVFNGKGRKETRAYIPKVQYSDDQTFDIDPPETVNGYREWLQLCCIRADNKRATPLFCKVSSLPKEVQSILQAATKSSISGDRVPSIGSCQRKRLEDYQHVIPQIMAAIPPEYGPHEITSVAALKNFVAFRSTSKFCRNLGRCHKSNNVYFAVSSQGLCQKCYCRCDTLDGRRYSRCMDFQSENFRIDERVIFEVLRISEDDMIRKNDTYEEQVIENKMMMPSQKKSKSFDDILSTLVVPKRKKRR